METLKKEINEFHLPRFEELPNMDLYMDQLITYITKHLDLICSSSDVPYLTKSMVNNYVKQGVIPPTVKKRYKQEHVAYITILCILKQMYSIGEIKQMIAVQSANYDISQSYDYICVEIENALRSTFSNTSIMDDTALVQDKKERLLVRYGAIAFAHKFYTQKLLTITFHEVESRGKECV